MTILKIVKIDEKNFNKGEDLLYLRGSLKF
jgi:hypothetical protein